MIALVLALLQAAPAPEEAITVMGRRVAALSVILGRDPKGHLACNLSESSGDQAIDVALCNAAARCFKAGSTAPEAMRACIEARKPAILEDFAARVRARHG